MLLRHLCIKQCNSPHSTHEKGLPSSIILLSDPLRLTSETYRCDRKYLLYPLIVHAIPTLSVSFNKYIHCGCLPLAQF